MKAFIPMALLFLAASSALAQSGSPPAPGTVGPVDWIYIPGVSSTGTYTIQWGTAMFYPEAYELEEDTNSGFTNPTQIYSGAGQSHTVSGKGNGTYYYRVRGINNTYGTQGSWLDGDHPQVVDSSLSVPSAPPAPASVSAPSTSSSGLIPVTWSSVSGAAGYDVQHSSRYGLIGPIPPPSPNMWSSFATAASNVAGTSYTDLGTDGREYRYRVRAYVAVGAYKLYSLWSSNSAGCTVSLQTPAAPSSITVPASSSTGTYTVSWSSETSSASYELEEDTNSGFSAPVQVYAGASTSFQVTGRSNGSYSYRVRGVNAGYSGAYATGANPCVVSLRGTLTLSLGPSNPAGTELPGATGASVIQFSLATDAVETATVTALTVTMSGTLALSPDATGAALVVDADGNGRKDAGETVLGTLSSLSGTTLAFTGLSRSISPSSTERWLVTIDLASGAPVGSTFAGAVASNADVSATGSLSAAPFVAGAPVQGPTKTVQTVGSLAVMPGAGNPGASGAVTGSMAVAMLEIEVAAGAVEGVTLTSIAVRGDGSGNEASGVAGAFLYLDADGNDAFNPVLDTLVGGPLTFAADDGTVAFTLSRAIPANGSARFFVVYNFDDAASIGSQFRAGFSSNADASGTGALSGKSVSVSGAPVWGGMVTVLSPPPVPGKEGGSCGGGASTAGPGGALGLALLLLAGLAARRAALRR